jgi:DNA-binding MarR family transcriptional regulator
MEPEALDPLLHQAVRLRIVTLLFKNRELAVATIRQQLQLTDGNLASHLTKLVAADYVKTGHVLAGLSFELRAKITPRGSEAFRTYLRALRRLLEEVPEAFEGSLPSIPEASGPRVVDLGRKDVA